MSDNIPNIPEEARKYFEKITRTIIEKEFRDFTTKMKEMIGRGEVPQIFPCLQVVSVTTMEDIGLQVAAEFHPFVEYGHEDEMKERAKEIAQECIEENKIPIAVFLCSEASGYQASKEIMSKIKENGGLTEDLQKELVAEKKANPDKNHDILIIAGKAPNHREETLFYSHILAKNAQDNVVPMSEEEYKYVKGQGFAFELETYSTPKNPDENSDGAITGLEGSALLALELILDVFGNEVVNRPESILNRAKKAKEESKSNVDVASKINKKANVKWEEGDE